jgi:hypothetical protein
MTEQHLIANPFGASAAPASALAAAEPHRHEAEIQAAMTIAKKFPRDVVRAMDRILSACTRPSLAEAALYAYPRGSELVTGPSIRLAEAIAQNWGNLQIGVRELSQSRGESTVEAFAWDLETNMRQSKVFQVAHVRHTRRGQTKLEDPRDIYELVANQGARRLRACILGVVPGDVVETAVRQCEVTQANAGGAPEEQIRKLVESFAKIGVTQEQITAFLGHRLDSVVGAEVLRLRKVYTSIRDGMASAADFFQPGKDADTKPETATLAEKVKSAASGRGKSPKPTEPQSPATESEPQ